MGFRINTNMEAISASKNIRKNTSEKENISSKLSSGDRITKSADDAAGLAISDKLRSHIKSMKQADRNTNDGISMVQVAEGALGETTNMLTRLRELAIQAASDTVGEQERKFTNLEYQQLLGEIQRVAEVTEYNGYKLLDGSADTIEIQVGIRNDDFQDRIIFDTSALNSTVGNIGVDGNSIETKDDARSSLEGIDEAIGKVIEQRATLGALQNRLQVTTNNLQTSIENSSAADSQIRDLDYAEGAADMARVSILESAGTSVLAQANVSQQNALRLIG